VTGNRILDELPLSAQRTLDKAIVTLAAGDEVLTPGERIAHALFPTSAVCSLVMHLDSGDKFITGGQSIDD